MQHRGSTPDGVVDHLRADAGLIERLVHERVSAHPFAVVPGVHALGDDIGLFFVSADQPAVSLERQDVTNHEPQFVMHLDGALVGGASLKADEFLAIAKAA